MEFTVIRKARGGMSTSVDYFNATELVSVTRGVYLLFVFIMIMMLSTSNS